MHLILKKRELITVDVNYFMPDHQSLLQSFIWQTEDLWPDIPRIYKFLSYWERNIPSKIHRVFVICQDGLNWKNISHYGDYK